MKTALKPNGIAPSTSRYAVGAKGGKVAQAWQYIWDRLDKHTYRDGTQLAEQAAQVFHILPVSILSHLHRMAAEGVLETEVRPAQTTVFRGGKEHPATRKRTHYRIAQPPESGYAKPPAPKGITEDHPLKHRDPRYYGGTGPAENEIMTEIESAVPAATFRAPS